MMRAWVIPWIGALFIASGFWLLFGTNGANGEVVQHEVPSLTQWGKIYALLLLAALGVAYLVWRRPIMQAQAVLETSPLGAKGSPMVDWSAYLRLLVGMEVLAGVLIGVLSQTIEGFSNLDALGIIGATAIVAFVLHLLLLSRGGGNAS